MAENEFKTSFSTAAETKRSSDVAGEAEVQDKAESSAAETILDSLAIDESKQGHDLLTDPDESSIEAVILANFFVIRAAICVDDLTSSLPCRLELRFFFFFYGLCNMLIFRFL